VQIENEYGAYGDDPVYLRKLVELNRDIGLTVPFTTVDQPTPDMLENGSIAGLHKTASFGSRSLERLATLRQHQPDGPLMCSEFWDGWFDHWGAHHHTTSVEESARDLDDLLSAGASVNIYMFHGGTNAGFTNGANDKGVYQPLVTSYDYDAPLDEAGNPTAKYWAFREVLSRYTALADEDVPAEASDASVLDARLTSVVPLAHVVESLGSWASFDHVPTMEELGGFEGFALYRTEIDEAGAGVLEFAEVRDRAIVTLDGAPVGVLARDHHDHAIALPAGARGTLEILLEDQGRVNYGARIGEAKGLIGPALLNGRPPAQWQAMALDLNDLSAVRDAASAAATEAEVLAGPAFGVGEFVQDEPADLFLSTRGWGKGSVWINGVNIGRYWSRGPQHTLYVPAPLVRAGANEIIVLELQAARTRVEFVARPDLGHTES
jgi:beta-galactosidase